MKTKVDLVGLAKEIRELDYIVDGSKALMAFNPCTKTKDIFEESTENEFPLLKLIILEICEYCKAEALYIMINIIPPGVIVPTHTDTLKSHSEFGDRPKLQRYHLPITTNDKCYWYDLITGKIQMEAGIWYGPVPYWVEHNVENLGETERIHLVVDLNKKYDLETDVFVAPVVILPDIIEQTVSTKTELTKSKVEEIVERHKAKQQNSGG